MALKKFLQELKSKMEERRFPYITSSILSLGAAVAILGRPDGSKDQSIVGYIRRFKKKVYSFAREKDTGIPILPPQEQPKPTIIFDCEDFLVKKKFSFFSFDFLVTKRAFTDLFLFHSAHLYELVHASESPVSFSRHLLHRIDPYGCISYKVYCKDKKMFSSKHLNRPLEKVVVISTREDEYHEDFDDNILKLDKWPGSPERGLLDLLNFLHNLYFTRIEDFRGTLKSYLGKDFYSAYERVQKKIFVQRNLFSWNVEKRYRERINRIDEKRQKDFERAKEIMDRDLQGKDVKEEGSILGYVFGLGIKALI
ncbi:putative TFIIF-interacting CTD phosphatase [Encephalitozoon hellem ATCC 50504]|uniref:NLI interacting factor-like phosphatase n=1 Tax=Encephalitozoon hellem TaxID=27973 RepID=A0A9Q9FAD3_ENCHE|nr:putative TFIIF-interacting CTD phosphatase [Encephalitozoon hellem ATCC 50504]AFM99151.1 putative TFIIF-interacting CTD phosphatase [Encephalitozoon hellem ATCC 50504]UTX44137.1 NLI interacting factor-like phosphatase [Encephalitozoon hellem]WEL39626.1 NLI interacting factor-like phosphatase [Encephalitozoon hellem]|eukprot:XP_003888132.1 putative TFIIF-interacting CTD phosphatase [Encephalitozoon hellem ATCC 50504]